MKGYLGDDWARFYYRLWWQREHLLRRVDTFALSDRSILSQAITFDVDWREISSLIPASATDAVETATAEPSSGLGPHPPTGPVSLYVPLISLNRELFLNVDCVDAGGSVLHIARRQANRRIAAHIIIGCCLAAGTPANTGEDAYRRLLDDLAQFDSDSGPGASDQHRQSLIRGLAEHGLPDGGDALQDLINDLRSQFVQSVYVTAPSQPIIVIKLRFETELAPTSDNPARPSRQKTTPPQDLDPEDLEPSPEASRTDPTARPRRTSGIDRLRVARRRWPWLSLIGLKATRIELENCAIGLRNRKDADGRPIKLHPFHTRFVAPAGTMIDDIAVYRDNASHPVVDDKLQIRFHHERGTIFDEGIKSGRYRVSIKLNPKRGLFLFPALSALLLLTSLTLAALILGPIKLDKHDAAFATALLAVPSLTAVLLARDTEHEMLSVMSGFSRTLTITAAFFAALSGAAVATLDPNGPIHTTWTFWLLFISLTLSVATSLLCIWQVFRIHQMRSIVETRLREGSAYVANQNEQHHYRVLEAMSIMGFGILAVTILLNLEHIVPLLTSRWP